MRTESISRGAERPPPQRPNLDGPVESQTARQSRAVCGLSYARAGMDPIVRWLRELPPKVADVLLSALATFVAVGGTAAQRTPHGYRHADALAYVLSAIAGASLVARRRRPLAVFAVALAAMLVFAARGYPSGPALLTVLIAVYTAASLDTRVRSLLLGVLAGVGLSASRLVFTSETAGSTAV